MTRLLRAPPRGAFILSGTLCRIPVQDNERPTLRVTPPASEENMPRTAHRPQEEAPQFSPDRLKAFIETRLARREDPTRIANAVRAHFGIAIESEQIVPYWKGEVTLPTQTERRQDKESDQFPADEPKAPLFTRLACDEAEPAKPPVLHRA